MNEYEENLKQGINMYGSNAYNTYTQNNIGIESPEKLISMLYQGVLRFNAQAKKAMSENDREKRVYWINRSTAIIAELVSVLDMKQGQISQYLEGLYNYEIKLLMEANLTNDVSKIDEVSNVFKGLSEAWNESTNVAR